MNQRAWIFILVSVLAGLNLASIRKAEDPIRDTQTNPILYQQKMEEEKDGKKGPLLYSVKNNPHDNFFADPPYQSSEKASAPKAVAEETAVSAEAVGWGEEKPEGSQEVLESETSTSSSMELVTEEKTVPDPEASGQPVQEDDYWW
jgi:hypothetical protein